MRIFTWLCRKEISCLFEQNGQLTRNLKRAEDARHKSECELGQVKKKLNELQFAYDQLKIDFDKRSQDYREAELLIERMNHDLTEKSETIQRLQQERQKAGNEDAEHCAELFKAAIANGTKFATEAYRKKSRNNMCHAGRISEDTHKLVKDFCKKRKVSFRWIMELSCSICVPLFDASIIAVQKRAEKEQPKTKIQSEKNVEASRSKVRAEMDRNEPRTKRYHAMMKPSVFENIKRIAAKRHQSVNNYIENLMLDEIERAHKNV